MMKRIAMLFVALLAVVAVKVYADDMQHMQHSATAAATKTATKADAAQPATVQGEIVDLGCYLGHEAKGMDHQSCAQKCLANGMPMGLLTTDGKLYLLTVSHESADPFNQAKQWAAEQVVVTGPVLERGGLKAIEVDQVKKADRSHVVL